MTCTSCGETPNIKKEQAFPNAVVEINNPEQLVLLRKVIIPASMGTEDDVPASIGKYRNVILQYEANNRLYLYSSDGIPTAIEGDVPQEVLDRITELESDLATEAELRATADAGLGDRIDSVSDSVDSLSSSLSAETAAREAADTALSARVDTLATNLTNETNARQTADTSLDNRVTSIEGKIPNQASAQNQLADKDFVNSSVATNTANYISNNGQPFNSLAELEAYTGTLTNNDYAFVVGTDSAGNTTYTRYKYVASSGQWAEEYVLNNSSFTAAQWAAINSNITSGAVDKLSDLANIQTIGANLTLTNGELSATDTTYTAGTGLDLTGTVFSADTSVLATQTDLASKQDTLTAGANIQINNSTISATDTTYSGFIGTDGTTTGTAGLVPAPATTDAGKYLKADGTWDTVQAGPTVVQTTGTSTTDVMSQNAVTSMVFADPSTRRRVSIGNGSTNNDWAVTIGNGSAGLYGTCLGFGGGAAGYSAVAFSDGAARGRYSVALPGGEVSNDSSGKGVFQIGMTKSHALTEGYNNSQYRLLTGLYDPQSDHDAATKGYVDTAIAGISAPDVFTTNEWDALWA